MVPSLLNSEKKITEKLKDNNSINYAKVTVVNLIIISILLV